MLCICEVSVSLVSLLSFVSPVNITSREFPMLFFFKLISILLLKILTDAWLNTSLVETAGTSSFDKAVIKSVISEIVTIEHVLYQYHLLHF